MGPKIHTLDETVFDNITEPSAYWVGYLMADGSIYYGKTGYPRIDLTLAKRDRLKLVKFKNFLNCTNPILPRVAMVNGKTIVQYALRFSSKKIADMLIGFGVTPRKSLTAKVIGLEENKHFWRGVLDGDGSIKCPYYIPATMEVSVYKKRIILANIDSSKLSDLALEDYKREMKDICFDLHPSILLAKCPGCNTNNSLKIPFFINGNSHVPRT